MALPAVDPAVRRFCQTLLKVELHAHVTGSISDKTLGHVLSRRHQAAILDSCHVWGDMADVFAMFKTLHDVIDNTDDVYTVMHDVIHDFAQDGVRYLELRSTLRDVPENGMTKRSHLETLLRAIQDCAYLHCTTRLLVSIDRSLGLKSARETVDLAIEYKKSTGLVVGIDLSGNPYSGDASTYYQEILRAKNNGLKLGLHLGEIPHQDKETKKLLELIPDRIGHGTYLQQGGSDNLNIVLKNKIPLELCLTSNLKTKTVESYDDHHFDFWRGRKHPLVICTDDKGVFRTSLSDEYAVVMTVFGLNTEQMWNLVLQSVEFIFGDAEMKDKLRSEMLGLWEKPEKENI